jgi:hypothetical protein
MEVDMSSIAFALFVFGLIMIGLAIFNPSNATPARRATGAGVGIFAALLGLLLGMGHDDDHRRLDRWDS